MAIPPHRAPGDTGHIGDHNDVADVLTANAVLVAATSAGLTAHTGGTDPHGDRNYADSTKAAIAHTHTYPVTSVNAKTGVVVLVPADIGAESPAGAQTKVDTASALLVPLTQKGANNGVATLDGSGKVPSAQLPAGSGVTSVNGSSGAVTLVAADVGAIATTARGAASGVASLDGSTLVPTAQIPPLDTAKITTGTFAIARIPTGTSSSTVSLGDHTHTYPVSSVNSQTGAVVLTAADVSAVPTTRQVIAGTGTTGGGALSSDVTIAVAYGTSSTTAAVGNDSRITGAAQKASNLSDLSSASAARTNLGINTTTLMLSDQTNATSSLQDITALGLAVPIGNIEFDFVIGYVGGSTSNGITMALNGPTTSTLLYFFHIQPTASTHSIAGKQAFASNQPGTSTTSSASNIYLVRIWGTAVTTATGTLMPRFFSNDGSTTVTIKAGSKGRLWPL